MNKKVIFIFMIIVVILFSGQQLLLASNYKLNVDDQLLITVWGHPDLKQEVVVGPDGSISFPLIDKVKAEGLTVGQLSEKISRELAQYIKNPRVNVNLIKYQKRQVMVMGEVKRPGTYQLTEDKRVLDLISLAGGVSPTGDMSAVTLTRGEQVHRINLEAILSGKGEGNSNLLLKDGDVLYIPEKIIEVSILGQVKKPGHYQLEKGARLSDLLAMAGSLSEKAARKATYTSSEGLEKIDLDRLLKGEGQNPILKEGDSVFIPETIYQVTVSGEIKNPGSYPWSEGLHLADIVAQAGNPTEEGNPQEVKVIRADGSVQVFNLEEYILQNKQEENPRLQPGDNIIVKEYESGARVTILGEVNKPGTYPWQESLHLADLLAQAGNQTERGDLDNIKIIHTDGSVEEVNLGQYLLDKNGQGNLLLERGDIVVINESKSLDWQKVFFFVSGFNAVKDLLEIDW